MVLGLRTKNKRGTSFHVNYDIFIQEIKPWPPSQSLKTLRSVVLQWENGEHNSGTTNTVAPYIGSSVAEGKIEFKESFKLDTTLLKEGPSRSIDRGPFQKNVLEFNLYEPRRDRSKGQHLGNAVIDLAEFGVIKEAVIVNVPVHSKRSFRNTAEPMLYVKIQPFREDNASSSSKEALRKQVAVNNDGKESVSGLMNEEYAEEAEILSIPDDDISSHSSLANSSSTTEGNADFSAYSSPDVQDRYKGESRILAENKVVGDGETTLHLDCVSAEEDLNSLTREVNFSCASTGNSGPVSPADLNTTNDSLGNRFNSLSSSPTQSSMVVAENFDILDEVSSLSLAHRGEITHTSTKDLLDKMIDRDTQETSNEDLTQKKTTDKRDQQEKDQKEEDTASDCAYHKIAESGIEFSPMGAVPVIKAEMVEYSSTDDQYISDMHQTLCAASVVNADVIPILEKKDCSKNNQVRVSSQEFPREKVSGTCTSERWKNIKFSVRSPSHLKGNVTGESGHEYKEDVKEIDIQGSIYDNGTNSGTDEGVNDDKSTDLSSISGMVKRTSRVKRSSFSNNKVQELQLRVNLLEGELREVAAIEIGLYSIPADHGSSSHKVHTPARRLSRLCRHASRQWSVERRASAARSVISGLALAAKACGNDVPRLTFWLSNTIILKAIITETIRQPGTVKSNGLYSVNNSSGGVPKSRSSPLKWESVSHENEKIPFAEDFDDWDDPETFVQALHKIETWMFHRIVESVWWQAFTPRMHYIKEECDGNRKAHKKSYQSVTSMNEQQPANSSIEIWKKAFQDASERLCPVRAGGHECGCLPMLARLVMEQCVSRLDVAMFNAIMRDSNDGITTHPVSDPISDLNVLPITFGELSFGAGARLKNAIGNWSRLLSNLFGMDVDDCDENEQDDNVNPVSRIKPFHFLNALSDLLMLPKDMLLDSAIRKEICPAFSSSMILQILERFVPDEFCPDPIPSALFEALDSEELLNNNHEEIRNIPCSASSIIYYSPSVASIHSIIGEIRSTSHLRRCGSSLVRKCHTSDDELDELDSPLSAIMTSVSSTVKDESRSRGSPIRYQLLREVWRDDEWS